MSGYIYNDRSLDIEEEVTDGVEDTDGGDCPSHYCQDLPNQIIDCWLMLSVGDIDGLYFGHKHGLLSGLVAVSPPRPDRVPVVLAVLLVVALNNYRNDLEVIEEVELLPLGLEILHDLPCVEVALQLVDVALDVLALVGDGEVEGIVAQTET